MTPCPLIHRLVLLILSLIATATTAGAQTDSLRRVAGGGDGLTVPALQAMYQLGRYYTGRDLDSAQYWIDRMRAAAERAQEPTQQTLALRWRGVIEQYRGSLDSSILWYFRALDAVGEDIATTALIYNSIGITYDELRNFTAAKDYFLRAIALNDRAGLSERNPSVYNNLAGIYRLEGQLDSALATYDLTERLLDEVSPNDDGSIRYSVYYGRGLVLNYLERYQAALTDMYAARDLASRSGNTYAILLISNGIIKVLISSGRLDMAERALAEQYPRIVEFDNPYLYKDYYNYLTELDTTRGDFRQALLHYKQYAAISDSIAGAERAERITELENSFTARQQRRDIAQLQLTNATQQRHSILLCVVVGLLLLLTLQTYRRYTVAKRARQRTAQELEDKTLLMQEIHHRAKNNLSTIEGLLTLQQEMITVGDARQALENSRRRVLSIALLHDQLYETDQPGRVDLKEYLNQLLAQLTDEQRLMPYELSATSVSIDISTAVPIGLIVNEAVANALEHAFARRPGGEDKLYVAAQTVDDGTLLRLFIRDNGPGYDAGAKSSRSRGGLFLIDGLVEQLKGSISRHNEAGAVLNLTIPLV